MSLHDFHVLKLFLIKYYSTSSVKSIKFHTITIKLKQSSGNYIRSKNILLFLFHKLNSSAILEMYLSTCILRLARSCCWWTLGFWRWWAFLSCTSCTFSHQACMIGVLSIFASQWCILYCVCWVSIRVWINRLMFRRPRSWSFGNGLTNAFWSHEYESPSSILHLPGKQLIWSIKYKHFSGSGEEQFVSFLQLHLQIAESCALVL